MQILDTHKIVGVDIDDTLIGNGFASRQLQNYILKNYRQKKFYLITFRTGEWVDAVWQHIAYENDQLDERIFRGLFGIPEEIRAGFQKYIYTAKRMQITRLNDPEDEEKLLEYEVYKNQYLEWKGKKAHELGCTILIDDMTDHVRQGCIKYNVKLVHPDAL